MANAYVHTQGPCRLKVLTSHSPKVKGWKKAFPLAMLINRKKDSKSNIEFCNPFQFETLTLGA